MDIRTGLEAVIIIAIFCGLLAYTSEAQEVAYCKNAQTGEIIVIQAGYACPMGYYRI